MKRRDILKIGALITISPLTLLSNKPAQSLSSQLNKLKYQCFKEWYDKLRLIESNFYNKIINLHQDDIAKILVIEKPYEEYNNIYVSIWLKTDTYWWARNFNLYWNKNHNSPKPEEVMLDLYNKFYRYLHFGDGFDIPLDCKKNLASITNDENSFQLNFNLPRPIC